MQKSTLYNQIFAEILDNLVNKYSPALADDDDIDIDTVFRNSDIYSIGKRDALYIKYIRSYTDSYVKRIKGQSKMKWIFFLVILFLLFSLVMGTIITILIIANKSKSTINDIAIIGTSMAGVISAFIVLPKVIAKNLFPPTDDDHSAEIFKRVIKNDMKLRQFHNITNTNAIQQNNNFKQYEEIDDEDSL